MKSYNYGSTLQAYALTEYVCSLGYDAEVIDFTDMTLSHNRKMYRINMFTRLFCCLMHPSLLINEYQRIKSVRATVQRTPLEKSRKFDDFFTSSLRLSKETYLSQDAFAAFVCGSDQVWKTSLPGLHSFFFLRFADNDKRIAYAPSFGSSEVPSYNRKRLAHYLQEIPFLSVREISGISIIRELTGKTVTQALDPVLLVDARFWRSRYECPVKDTQYVLCYFLDDNQEGLAFAQTIAKANSFDLINISDGEESCQFIPSPIEFVQLIDNAQYVVTDSFHGAAFSCELNTPFCVFERNYSASPEQKTRLDSFLHLVDFENRKYCQDFDDSIEMDFSRCNEVLETKRKESAQFLRRSLQEATSR